MCNARLDPFLRTFEELDHVNADKLGGNALYKKDMSDAIETTKIRPVTANGGCFVAGTLVHTKEGLVSIEKIKVGDWVLSQPEETGELAYKCVINTFIFEDKKVYSVSFMTTDAAFSVIATGNHPFWVKNKGWTRADQMSGGEVLELSDGRTAEVFDVSPVLRTTRENIGWIRGGYGLYDPDQELGRVIDLRNNSIIIDFNNDNSIPNDGFWWDNTNYLNTKVYNFEIEDYHTYYVGELGVWVHNTSNSHYRTIIKSTC